MRHRTHLPLLACLALVGCSSGDAPARVQTTQPPSRASEAPGAAMGERRAPDESAMDEPPTEDPYTEARIALVNHLRDQGIDDPRVLRAILRVPRHRMVPEALRPYAYVDQALPIGHDQTISQPYVVALMTQLADIQEGERVLEIGTGSGYQAAVLAELGAQVRSIEIVEPLARRTRALLDGLGYSRIETRIGDGYRGWPEAAPFDAILITAAPPEIPEPLKAQLAVGGKLVVPVGRGFQELIVLTRTERGFESQRSIPVLFVPMTGEAQERSGD